MKNLKVFIVDDGPDFADFADGVEALLTREGYVVFTVQNAQEEESEAVQELLRTSARTCLAEPITSDKLLQTIDESL